MMHVVDVHLTLTHKHFTDGSSRLPSPNTIKICMESFKGNQYALTHTHILNVFFVHTLEFAETCKTRSNVVGSKK